MGQFVNDPVRDRIICQDHDRWVTSIPDYGDEQEEEEEDIEEN